MSNKKKKVVKGTRGKSKATTVHPSPSKITYKDPNPVGNRLNLAFFSKYGKNDVLLREADKSFFTFYHETLPEMFKNYDP